MKIVSFYDLAPGALAKLKDHFPAHRARLEEFHARGLLIADERGLHLTTRSSQSGVPSGLVFHDATGP